MSIAVIGAQGQLGQALMRQLAGQAVACGRADLDITDGNAVQRVIGQIRPQAVINCAAYTSVDRAERDADACRAVNAEAVASLAEACRRWDLPLVQISTDYVFGRDATRTAPFRETDTPGPQSVYGRTKLEGESHAQCWRRHFVVRTCGLYGPSLRQNNFVDTVLRLARERKPLRVVGDQYCTPSYTHDVARAIRFLLSTDAYGIYHVVNGGATTWYDFAREIGKQMELDLTVQRITTTDYAAPAPRPRYSVLETSKFCALGGPELPPWRDALSSYLTQYAGS